MTDNYRGTIVFLKCGKPSESMRVGYRFLALNRTPLQSAITLRFSSASALYTGSSTSSQTDNFHIHNGRWLWNHEISAFKTLKVLLSQLCTNSPYRRSKNLIHPIQCCGSSERFLQGCFRSTMYQHGETRRRYALVTTFHDFR